MTHRFKSLTNLVQMVREFAGNDPEANELGLDECVREVLLREFGMEPTNEEIKRVADALKTPCVPTDEFFEDWDPKDDFPHLFQTGGGRHIVHKGEPMS